MPAISLVLPIYNEAESISKDIPKLQDALAKSGWEFEIIAVNDCSSDNSAKELQKIKGITVLHNPENSGYSASIKRGLRQAKYEWVGITDIDGTYPNEDILRLIKSSGGYDMVVGARTGDKVSTPLSRRPAKWILGKMANFLVGKKIDDINSGLRIFKKDKALEFMHLYPERFSFTTTITLAFLTNSYPVNFVPINYFKRRGSSGIRPKDFFGFAHLMFRIVMYFRPLKFFFAPALLMIVTGIIYGALQTMANPEKGIGELPILLTLSGIQVLFLGMLADLVVRSRK